MASHIVIARDAGLKLDTARDISDLIGAMFGADGLILDEHDLAPEFFELRSGLLGELFQKLTNYGLRTAFIVADPSRYGERFSELAFEHATHNRIRFVRSSEDARAWLEPRGKETE